MNSQGHVSQRPKCRRCIHYGSEQVCENQSSSCCGCKMISEQFCNKFDDGDKHHEIESSSVKLYHKTGATMCCCCGNGDWVRKDCVAKVEIDSINGHPVFAFSDDVFFCHCGCFYALFDGYAYFLKINTRGHKIETDIKKNHGVRRGSSFFMFKGMTFDSEEKLQEEILRNAN